MRRFIDIMENSQIELFVNSLSTDDVGFEKIGNKLIRFEGFTDACWEDAEQKGKTISQLEDEMISEWQSYHPEYKMIEHGWTHGSDFHTDTTFYAVFTI
jgi:hypothetical protein